MAPTKTSGGDVWAIGLSADESYLACTTSDGRIHVWDLAGRERIQTYETGSSTGGGSFAMAVDLSRDGKLTASGHESGAVYVFNNDAGRMAYSLSGRVPPPPCDGEGRIMANIGRLQDWSSLFEQLPSHLDANVLQPLEMLVSSPFTTWSMASMLATFQPLRPGRRGSLLWTGTRLASTSSAARWMERLKFGMWHGAPASQRTARQRTQYGASGGCQRVTEFWRQG